MADLPKSWRRTLTVLKVLMEGHEVKLDGYRVTARETVAGLPRLVVLATRESDGEDVPLGLDWTIEHLVGAVSRMEDEEFIGTVGSAVLTGLHQQGRVEPT